VGSIPPLSRQARATVPRLFGVVIATAFGATVSGNAALHEDLH
jgi:hypothetical protein